MGQKHYGKRIRPKDHPNRFRYLTAPTWKEIEFVVKRTGVNYAQFEKHFGLYYRCLHKVKAGTHQMPVHSWHLIFQNLDDSKPLNFADPDKDLLTAPEDYVSPKPEPQRTKPVEDDPIISSFR